MRCSIWNVFIQTQQIAFDAMRCDVMWWSVLLFFLLLLVFQSCAFSKRNRIPIRICAIFLFLFQFHLLQFSLLVFRRLLDYYWDSENERKKNDFFLYTVAQLCLFQWIGSRATPQMRNIIFSKGASRKTFFISFHFNIKTKSMINGEWGKDWKMFDATYCSLGFVDLRYAICDMRFTIYDSSMLRVYHNNV